MRHMTIRLADFFFTFMFMGVGIVLAGKAVSLSNFYTDNVYLDFIAACLIGAATIIAYAFVYNVFLKVFASDYIYWRYHLYMVARIYRAVTRKGASPSVTPPKAGRFWQDTPSPWWRPDDAPPSFTAKSILIGGLCIAALATVSVYLRGLN